jgi:hypothetical protein
MGRWRVVVVVVVVVVVERSGAEWSDGGVSAWSGRGVLPHGAGAAMERR